MVSRLLLKYLYNWGMRHWQRRGRRTLIYNIFWGVKYASVFIFPFAIELWLQQMADNHQALPKRLAYDRGGRGAKVIKGWRF